jgi:alpha-beta hydrolase superfamily lysophospholipase
MRLGLLLSLLMLALPLGAAERQVSLQVDGGTLYGTEWLPDGGGKVPVVLLHSGSGPTDRDGNSGMLSGPNDSLRMVAEALAKRGIASVRYDKRGIGSSAWKGWKEEDVRLDDYIGDAVAWLRQLRAVVRPRRPEGLLLEHMQLVAHLRRLLELEVLGVVDHELSRGA